MKLVSLYVFCCAALTSGALLVGGLAQAQSNGPKGASDKVAVGTVSVLASPVASVAGSTQGEPVAGSMLAGIGSVFVVTGIHEGAGESVELIIESVDKAGKASVKLAKSAFKELGVSVGTSVEAVQSSTGTALVTSGQVLAFIPNTVGEALLYRERVQE